MKPHLCLFTDSLEPSGVGEHMLTLASELRRTFQISFICPPNDAGRKLLNRATMRGLEVVPLEARQPGPQEDALVAWLQTHNVQVFHSHAGIAWEGHIGVYAAHRARVPAIVRTEHLPNLITNETQHEDHRRMMSHVHRTICVSEEVRASFIQDGTSRNKLAVVRNGIAITYNRKDPAAIRARLRIPEDATLLLTVGRMCEQKGYQYLVEAVPYLLKDYPSLYFLWVGEGEMMGYIRGRVQSLCIEKHVLFLGRRSDVGEIMAGADLFVLPSCFEGLPLVVLEAMSAGLPIVGTQVCGTAEAIVDGVTGRLVKSEDSPALVAGIKEALDNPQSARRWAKEAHKRVQKYFTARHMAAQTAAIYNELLASTTKPLAIGAVSRDQELVGQQLPTSNL